MNSEEMEGSMTWHTLPEHIIIDILSYLPLADRIQASYVCSVWNKCFKSPYLWTYFDFHFYEEKHSHLLKCINLIGEYFRSVCIKLDQASAVNRESACKLINGFAQLKRRRLRNIVVTFTGENPLFYAGLEFVSALVNLFGPPPEVCEMKTQLQEVDLSGLIVSYDDKLFNELSANHPDLRKLNIQNKTFICKVSPTCIMRLVQRCRKLTDLQLYNCSINEDILMAFTEEDRAPLKHLSIMFRREEKYIKDISRESWSRLVDKFPDFRVTLKFDHTIELLKIGNIIKPEIPVRTLRLETFTDIHSEVRMASAFYHNTLEKFVLNTRVERTAPQLNLALVEMAETCTKLCSLHVFCVLEQSTVEKIFELHPRIKENGTYTLKYTPEPHPWIPGKDF